jgi:hypothetical protein
MSDISIIKRNAYRAVVVAQSEKGKKFLEAVTDGLNNSFIEVDLVEEMVKFLKEEGLDVEVK